MQVDEKPVNAEIGFDTRVSMATKKTEPIPDLGDKAVYALEGVECQAPAVLALSTS